MRTFIAEKPSQGRDIARVLGCHSKADGFIHDGNQTRVTWCVGHLVQPADPAEYDPKYKQWTLEDLPIIPQKWKLQDNLSTTKQLAVVRELLKDTDEVVIATDADREGECIGKLVLARCGYKNGVKRLWLSALDDESIKKALANLKDGKETDPLFFAGLGRSRADWLTGLNYTRASTLLFGGNGNIFSVGRVQTPTLRLIVERDAEIANFTPKDYYIVGGQFMNANNESLVARWIEPEHAKGDDEGRCLDRSIAESVKSKCEYQTAVVTHFEKKQRKQSAPLCFALSDLQQKANDKYGYSAQDVLETAQSLYETHKATSYPRTDCGYLPSSQFEDASTILSNLKQIDQRLVEIINQADTSFKSKVWNDKKVDESSHHGIIPTTNAYVYLGKMSDKECNIYDLIVKGYIAQFLGDYVYLETQIALDCQAEVFKTKGIVTVEQGWKSIVQSNYHKNKEQQLPSLSQGDQLACSLIQIKDKKTTPPSHYTDATLLLAMKNAGRQVEDAEQKEILKEVSGIGTEATRANIIETLLKRNYVTRNKKYLLSSAKGQEIIQLLPSELSSVEITAQWEQKLDEVAKGQADIKEFLSLQSSLVTQMVDALKEKGKGYVKVIKNPCPKCGSEMVRLKAKQGNGFWWGCSNYQGEKEGKAGCGHRMKDVNGQPVGIPPEVKAEVKCVSCGGDLVQRSCRVKIKGRIRKKIFWGCKDYPSCQFSYPDVNGKPNLQAPKDGSKKDVTTKQLASQAPIALDIRVVPTDDQINQLFDSMTFNREN